MHTAAVQTVQTMSDVASSLAQPGWVCFERLLPETQLLSLRQALAHAVEECRVYQQRDGLGGVVMTGTAHHVLALPASEVTAPFWLLLSTLPRQLQSAIRRYFGSPFILNSFGGVINPPVSDSSPVPLRQAYVGHIHRDVRVFTGDFPLMLNMLVMLDDFTPDNGATWVLPGSHRASEKPEEAFFFEHAEQLCAPAGSVVLFNSNLWHAAGKNDTHLPRRALTLTWSKPLMKPQFDYLGCLEALERRENDDNADNDTENLKQLLGYFSRIPKTLDEWYQPREARYYQANQDSE
jgi:Phytanoyl-CoA dioxygenase (PhyH)